MRLGFPVRNDSPFTARNAFKRAQERIFQRVDEGEKPLHILRACIYT